MANEKEYKEIFEIIVDYDEFGNLKNNSQLKWLAYVNNELSKKILIRHFEKLLNN